MVGRLRTRALRFENGSRLRARAALSPLWGPNLAILADGVLRGAKLMVIFERNRSVLESALVFEREQLYRPTGDPFWSICQKASPEGPQSCSRSKTSAGSKTRRFRSKTTLNFAPLRTPPAKMARMGPQRGDRAALARRRLTIPNWCVFVRRRPSISPP